MNKNQLGSTVQYLEYLKLSGIDDLFLRSREENNSELNLETLQRKYSQCKKCDLAENRIKFVYGEGNSHARLVFIGEAPGADENRSGKPFVGKAGQLLTRILQAIGLTREEVYITNVVKCRPPNNRDPHTTEIESCRPYLDEQLKLIRPDLIVLLGRVAAVSLLDMKLSLAKFRGTTYLYNNIPTIVTYHPSALLRNPVYKRPTWEDFKKIRREYFSDNEPEVIDGN